MACCGSYPENCSHARVQNKNRVVQAANTKLTNNADIRYITVLVKLQTPN